jgi:hypothetical protein
MNVNTFVVNCVGWNDAIEDAHFQLTSVGPERKQQLEDCIAVFTRKMRDGEPWPGAQSASQNSEPCHVI